MAIRIPRGKSDNVIERIGKALEAYQVRSPGAQIDIYRQNSVSVRVRIIDSSFAGQSKVDRSKIVWGYLNSLDDDIQSDISTLILLSPDEKAVSFANLEFDDPTPSDF